MRRLNYFQNKPKLEKIDTYAYLERLGLRREDPTLPYLREIQKNHLRCIPHENLSIHFGKKTTWSASSLFDKMINRNRGGINLELNYLLYHLLSQLGYDCFLVAVSLKGVPEQQQPYGHMAIIVSFENDSPWLVDVGFKESIYQPKEIAHRKVQMDFNRYIMLEEDADSNWRIFKSADTTNFSEIYRFRLQEAQAIEFLQMHSFYQEDIDSPYRDGKYISQIFHEGRVELTDQILRHTLNGKLEEIPILNEDEFLSKMEEYFKISLKDLLKQ